MDMNIDTAIDYRYIYKYVLYVHFYYLRTYMIKAEKMSCKMYF